MLSDVKQRTVILEEEKAHLRLKIKELESSLHSLNMDLESRDVQLRDLKATRKIFQVKSPTIQNGKENGLSGNITPKVVTENRTANTTKTVVEKQTPRKTKPVVEKRTPSTTKPVVEKRTPSTKKTNTTKQVVENLTPSSTKANTTRKPVMENRTPNITKPGMEKLATQNRVPVKRTPQKPMPKPVWV